MVEKPTHAEAIASLHAWIDQLTEVETFTVANELVDVYDRAYRRKAPNGWVTLYVRGKVT